MIDGWKEIQVKFDRSINVSLDQLSNYEDICDHLKVVTSIIESI